MGDRHGTNTGCFTSPKRLDEGKKSPKFAENRKQQHGDVVQINYSCVGHVKSND